MSENSMSSADINMAYIAANRFGYGARGDELAQAQLDPKKWIATQLLPIYFDISLAHSNDVILEHAKFKKLKKQKKLQKNIRTKNSQSDNEVLKNNARNTLFRLSIDTLNQAIASPNSVSWRLLDFFSNHFSVTAHGRLMVGLAATLEREAIAPNLLGNFEDMLLAVEQHPAMLIYLNNEKSFGPHSRIAKKRKVGLNENLAREIMELHTLGVDGGYNQEDVVELAKGITGWSVKNPNKEGSAGFIFREYAHEPGARTLLAKTYAQGGIEQGKKMLRDLAMHPATVNFICSKIAHHFVSQTPLQSLITKMTATWMKNRGNIEQVMLSLFAADEAWIVSNQAFKTPREFVISTYRAISPKKVKGRTLINALANLGQKPFNAGSPAGFSDNENDWLGASALMARIDWSTMLSGGYTKVNAEKIIATVFGDSISQHTYQLVMRAESRQQAATLLLMSPEFQRK